MSALERSIEQLRRRMEQQARDPFALPFMNYSFEELASWKATIAQLDATSKLYGQRVDHLHQSTLQVLDHVDRLEVEVKEIIANVELIGVREKKITSGNCFVEEAIRLNYSVVDTQRWNNTLLWRKLINRSGDVEQCLLNTVSLGRDLALNITEDTQQYNNVGRGWECSLGGQSRGNSAVFGEISQIKEEIYRLQKMTKNIGEIMYERIEQFEEYFGEIQNEDKGLESGVEEESRNEGNGQLVLEQNQIELRVQIMKSNFQGETSGYSSREQFSEFDPFSQEQQQKCRVRKNKKYQAKKIKFIHGIPQKKSTVLRVVQCFSKGFQEYVDVNKCKRQFKSRINYQNAYIKRNKPYINEYKEEMQQITLQPITLRDIKQSLSVGFQNKNVSFRRLKMQYAELDPLDIYIAMLHLAAQMNCMLITDQF